MKIKQLILVSFLTIQIPLQLHASVTSLNNAQTNLNTAQAALAALLGTQNPNPVNPSGGGTTGGGGTSGGGTNQTPTTGGGTEANIVFAPMIVNDANQAIYVVMLDQNSNQINPTNIQLNASDFSYLLSNTASIKIVSNTHQQLIAATPVSTNNLYNVTNANNKWVLNSSPAPANPTPYTFTNSTTIPLIIAITIDEITNTQNVAPSAVYTQNISPSSSISVEAHANLSAISQTCNPAATYSIVLNTNDELTLTQTAATGNSIVNNSGWPMLITLTLPNDAFAYATISNGSSYKPNTTATNILVIPSILNSNAESSSAKSCAITNSNGELALQFAS